MQQGSGAWSFSAFLFAIAFLGFVAGALVTVSGVAPAGYIRDAYRAGTAAIEKLQAEYDPLNSDLWAEARTEKRGVTVYDPARSAPGLTLYTSGHASVAFLIDHDGKVVHQWQLPYSEVWEPGAAVTDPVPDAKIYFRRAHVFPNGDLLAIYIGHGDTPWGYGMVRISRDSELIWKNLLHFHHDFAIGEDGRIYGLTHEFRRKAPDDLEHLPDPVLEDFLTVVSPDGETLKSISLIDAMNRSRYRPQLWSISYFTLEDPLHTNAVDVLSTEDAALLKPAIPQAEAGQVLLSFRELGGGTIALMDVDSEEIVWAQHGAWRSQHDPDVLPNGNIMMFDNLGNFGNEGGRSRVIEVNPATTGIVWQYGGIEGEFLHSVIRSAQYPLPNGNVLITESDGGRLLEVTRDGDIVWEYINPVRAGEGDSLVPIVSWAQRLPLSQFEGAFRDAIAPSSLASEVNDP